MGVDGVAQFSDDDDHDDDHDDDDDGNEVLILEWMNKFTNRTIATTSY